MKTFKLTVAIMALLISFFQSCTREDQTQNNKQYILSRITTNYFGGFADSSSYYNVGYENNQISKLTGKWGDVYNLKYLPPSGFNRQSIVLDSCTYDNAGDKLLWATKWYNFSLYNASQLTYPTTTTGLVTYWSQSTLTNKARITYNAEGDISSIGYYNGNPDTLLFTINVTYTNTPNKLNEFYKNFTLIDPFCTSYELEEKSGKGFPVNIHYGKKCISSFTVTKANGSTINHVVSYQFNDGGYISKILIDGKPFMSYEYQ
jgi:hypothetical protein